MADLNAIVSGTSRPGVRPVVLLHGFGGSAKVWHRVQQALADKTLVIAYDLPGHAGSLGVPAGGAGQMAKAIGADIEARGLSDICLAGHSMGGAVSCLVAMRRADRVGSLVLLAPGGFGPEINHRALQRFSEATDREAIQASLEQMSGFNSIIPEALVTETVAARNEAGAVLSLQSIRASILVEEDGAILQGVLPREGLAGLPMPVRVLWGDQDTILPVHQSKDMPAQFDVTILPRTGHMLIDEAEDAVIETIGRAASA